MVPAALRTPKQTVTGLVKQRQSSARFRLDALVDTLCEPLQQLLGEKRFFLLDERWSSLDCLALGYLALALKAEVPQGWLRQGIKERYPGLCAFVARGMDECSGGEVSMNDAFLGDDSQPEAPSKPGKQTVLPWRAPAQKGLKSAGSTFLNSALSALPFQNSTIPSSSFSNQNVASPTSFALTSALVTASTAIAAAAGYLIYAGFSSEPEKRSLEDMGEAGAMLAGLDYGSREV